MQPTFTCKNCGNHFQGKFCNACGEKVYEKKDRSFLHIAEELFHFTSHFEGKFFTTLKTMFAHPGKLTLDYCGGIRKKYFSPLSFFMLLVILYLLFPFFKGLNMALSQHVHHSLYGKYALRKVIAVMQENKLDEAAVFEKFRLVSEKVSKFLLFIIIPVMGMVCAAFAAAKKKPLFDHFIFATETCSFFLLWGFLLLPIPVHLLSLAGVNVDSSQLITLIPNLLGSCIYVMLAARRFYHYPTAKAILFSAAFHLVLAVFIQYLYKFILFLISINLTH
jgi:hypothetical protein